MAVAKEFALPDLGDGLTGAEIVRWLVEVGDEVSAGRPVVEVETAKAMVEMECPYAGVVTERFGSVGDEVLVGHPLLTLSVEEDAAEPGPARGNPTGAGRPPAQRGAGGRRATGAAGRAAGDTGTGKATGRRGAQGQPARSAPASGVGDRAGQVLAGYGTGRVPPRRRTRSALNGEAQEPAPPGARDTPEDSGAEGSGAVASPLVRRLAREQGLDLRTLRGSGAGGVILRGDVEQAITRRRASGSVPAAGAPAPEAAEGIRLPLRGLRGAVAAKLTRSRQEVPDAAVWVEADATELMALRAAMNAAPPAGAREAAAGAGAAEAGAGGRVSVPALVARICTAALTRYPELNAMVDTAAHEIVRLPAVHLGFAAQTGRGLVVPVVRDAHTLTTDELAAEMSRLTQAARAGTLAPAELTGGTFTLNNYGVFGVDGASPILNLPEAAMLGVGRISAKPWVVDGELAVRQVVELSLTFDHRVCDGGVAGGFLRFVADCVERPALLLRSV